VTSRRLAGTPVTDVHRHLSGLIDLAFVDPALSEIASACEVVFTAVPHGAAMDIVPELLTCGTRVIDLSADYRLPQQVFEDTYKCPHTDPRAGDAVFGLPELHQGIAEADLVANPGCYPTGAILSAAPLADEGSIEYAIFDSKSGVSAPRAAQEPWKKNWFSASPKSLRT